jgi:sulfatase maturation enzyme AslB (radical SAM superfamily)
MVVSIDGLPAEHDIRRTPATYERILKNIVGQRVTVHCTVTSQMMKRVGYLEDFLAFWTPREEVHRVWFSIFTPQKGDALPEIFTAEEGSRVVSDLLMLRKRYSKLDMQAGLIQRFADPPASPDECVFA